MEDIQYLIWRTMKMNERVERKLEFIRNRVKQIKSICDCIEMDIDDVTEVGDTFIIESNFERIMREAENGKIEVRDIENLFDEED